MKTHVVETANGDITLKRPSFQEARELGPIIEELYMAPTPNDVLYSDDFERVMKAITASDEDFTRLFHDLDQEDVWQVWEEYCEFARVGAFLAESAASQQGRVAALQEIQLRQSKNQIEMMKKSGLVPEDFSLSTELIREAMEAQAEKSQKQSASGSTKPQMKGGKAKPKTR